MGDLLLGGFVAGIDLSGVEELSEGALLIAGREQLSSFGEVGGGGGDAHAIEGGAIAEILGVFRVGLLVGVKGSVVVFAGFCPAL